MFISRVGYCSFTVSLILPDEASSVEDGHGVEVSEDVEADGDD